MLEIAYVGSETAGDEYRRYMDRVPIPAFWREAA
jgi:hypothetical protein